MSIQKKVLSIAIAGCLSVSLTGLEAAPSATYQAIANDLTKSGEINFKKFMIELYDPLTDEPTGEYALFTKTFVNK